MSVIGDIVGNIVQGALNEILKKTTGTSKRVNRRKRALTATERLSKIEKLLKPAKRQASRRKTVRARAKTKRRSG